MKLNNFVKIIFAISLLINILQAEKIEILPDDIFNSSAEEFINEKHIVEEQGEKKVKDNADSFCLKIGTEPKNANIKILNYYNPNYKWAMYLNYGEYSFVVSKRGYYDKNITIKLNKDLYKKVILKRKNKVKSKIRHKKKRKIRYCTLRIKPNISGTTIKITNILPRYKPRILLPCRRTYNIKVMKRGYRTRRFSTHLQHNEAIPVNMRRR